MTGWNSGPARATFPVAVIAGYRAAEVADAILLAGGTLVADTNWEAGGAAIDAMLDRLSRGGVVMVEADGTAPDLLLAGLDAVAAAAAARGLPIVATLRATQIDLVAAALIEAHAVLLVEPTLAERAVALATVVPGHAAGSAVRETEGERLRHLHAEIARIADLLADLARHDAAEDRPADTVDARSDGYRAAPDDAPVDPQAIRQAIRARRMRDGFFARGLFEDPAWDMLLDLFAAEIEGVQVSVSSLCIAAAVAPTTALRWMGRLSDAGLLKRHPDPADRRRAFVALSPAASAGMHGYAAALRRAGLCFA